MSYFAKFMRWIKIHVFSRPYISLTFKLKGIAVTKAWSASETDSFKGTTTSASSETPSRSGKSRLRSCALALWDFVVFLTPGPFGLESVTLQGPHQCSEVLHAALMLNGSSCTACGDPCDPLTYDVRKPWPDYNFKPGTFGGFKDLSDEISTVSICLLQSFC